MVSVSEPSPSGALFPTFHYGALSGAKNAGNRVENPGIQEILIHRGEYHYGISKYRGKSCGDSNISCGFLRYKITFYINLFPKKVEYAILLQKSCLMEGKISK